MAKLTRMPVPIPGATDSISVIATAQTASASSYMVLVANPLSMLTSTAAVLTVTASPNPGGTTPPPGTRGSGGQGSSNGGGGAPSHWFLATLAVLAVWRAMKR